MKRITSILLIAIVLVSCKFKGANAVKEKNENPLSSIPDSISKLTTGKESLKNIVSYLSADNLEGRNTGTKGINNAANYIESYLRANKVESYFDAYRDDFTFKSTNDSIKAYNVVGFVEGNDPKLKDEFVIIGAHYDHIGFQSAVAKDSIANGANDNATGTAITMRIAKHFSESKTNKRSLIFALFSAEEFGLKGSEHLSKRLKNENIDVYTMINFEMLGVPFKDRNYEVFLTGFEKSNFAEKFNSYQGYTLIGASEISKKYNLFKRSDNFAFYTEFNVPSHTISSCDLTNFDHYHKVSDEIDQLDFKFMTTIKDKLIIGLEKLINTSTKEITLN